MSRADNAVDDLTELINIIVKKYVGQFTNSHGQIDLKKKSGFAGKLPTSLGGGGFKDHDHGGGVDQGQKLIEANTHESVILGPAAGAMHWQSAALASLIESLVPVQRIAVPVTNGDPDFPELIFDGGDVVLEMIDA